MLLLPQANTHAFFLISERLCSGSAYCKQTKVLEKSIMLNSTNNTEAGVVLFDERMYATPVLALFFTHSSICYKEKSSVTSQKKNLQQQLFAITGIACMVAICSKRQLIFAGYFSIKTALFCKSCFKKIHRISH